MLENTARGWHGAYSTIGRHSAEKYHVILHKDQILNQRTTKQAKQVIVDFLKRNNYTNIENDKEVLNLSNYSVNNQLDAIEDNIDIFQLNPDDLAKDRNKTTKKKRQKQHATKRGCASALHRTNPDNYKYHDMHIAQGNKKKLYIEPTCTKYNPKRDFVWKRVIIGPLWETKLGRDWSIRKDNDLNYKKHSEPLDTMAGKAFIDMSKQSQRGDCNAFKGIRFNNTKRFDGWNGNGNKRPLSVTPSAYSRSHTESHNKNTTTLPQTSLRPSTANTYSIKSKRISSARPTSVTTNHTSRPVTSTYRNSNTTTHTIGGGRINTGHNIMSSGIDDEDEISEAKSVISENEDNGNNNAVNDNNNNNNNMSLHSSSSEHNDSYEQYKHAYTKQFKKKRPHTAMHTTVNTNTINKRTATANSKCLTPTSSLATDSLVNNNTHHKNMRTQSSKFSTTQYNNNTAINITSSNKTKLYLNNKQRQQIKAPDFDMMISREYLERLSDNKNNLIPFSLPNFKQVRERPIMMVVYDQKTHNRKKPKEIKGIEPSLFYDPDKMLDKVNNHRPVIAPNFNRMASRPDDDNPLPSYMKKLYTRESAYVITDQTLRMNNYSDGKFRTNYTSFWPKKSFNKIVNLNLMNSEQFVENALGNKKEIESNNNYIAKSMKFYNKNYEDLMKESLLSRFDNVTFKTIKKENVIDQRDVEKFLKNIDNTTNTNV